MSDETNPSREVRPDDRWSKNAVKHDQYWLCECGVARTSCESLIRHLHKKGHFAECVTQSGEVIAFLAGGLEDQKYREPPDTARIKRRKRKNDPLFNDPLVE